MEWQGGVAAAVTVTDEVATRDLSAGSLLLQSQEGEVVAREEAEQRRQRVNEVLPEEANQQLGLGGSPNVKVGTSNVQRTRKKEGDVGMSGNDVDDDDGDGEEESDTEEKKEEASASAAAAAAGKEESTSSGNHAVCSICFDAVTVTSEERSTARLKCGHVFHLGR